LQEELKEQSAEVIGINRREFLKTAVGTAAGAELAISVVGQARANDVTPKTLHVDNP